MAADIKAKNWRLLKAESPMDFSPFIQMGHEIERVKLRF